MVAEEGVFGCQSQENAAVVCVFALDRSNI